MEQKDNMSMPKALASQVVKDATMTSVGQGHSLEQAALMAAMPSYQDANPLPRTLQARQPDGDAAGDGDLLDKSRAAAVNLQAYSLAAVNQIQHLIQMVGDLQSENAALKQELATLRALSHGVAMSNAMHRGVQETKGVTGTATNISGDSSTVVHQVYQVSPKETTQRTPSSYTAPPVGGVTERPSTTGSSYHGNREGGPDEHTSSTGRSNQEKPDEYARFLAKRISQGDQCKNLLREFGLTEVELQDLEVQHSQPLDGRIWGIRQGILKLGTHRAGINELLKNLSKVGLRSVADDFCSEFKLERLPERTVEAALPVAQNKFEKTLAPYLMLTQNLHQLTAITEGESALSQQEITTFMDAISWWSESQRSHFLSVENNGTLLSILEGWASIALEQHPQHVPVDCVEELVRCLRVLGRTHFLKKLKERLRNGVVGPFFKRNTYLRNLPYSALSEVARKLNIAGEHDWRHLADFAGFTTSQIEALKSNCMNNLPAEQFFSTWKTKNVTIWHLYSWAAQVERSDILEILEKERP